MEQTIKTFLTNQSPALCVLSTSNSKGMPEASVLAYAAREDLSVVLSTHSTTRKWKNLSEDIHVALVFGMSFTTPNVQYEGTAELVESSHPKFAETEAYFYSQRPETQKYKSDSTVYLVVTPNWMRLTDYTVHPPVIEEKNI